MILLRFPHVNYHYMYSPDLGWISWTFIVVAILLALFLIGHNLGVFLKQQTEPYMKFIYQMYPHSVVNQRPSLIERTAAQAIEKAIELSKFHNCLFVVRYPDSNEILCIADKGELTQVTPLKPLNNVKNQF